MRFVFFVFLHVSMLWANNNLRSLFCKPSCYVWSLHRCLLHAHAWEAPAYQYLEWEISSLKQIFFLIVLFLFFFITNRWLFKASDLTTQTYWFFFFFSLCEFLFCYSLKHFSELDWVAVHSDMHLQQKKTKQKKNQFHLWSCDNHDVLHFLLLSGVYLHWYE